MAQLVIPWIDSFAIYKSITTISAVRRILVAAQQEWADFDAARKAVVKEAVADRIGDQWERYNIRLVCPAFVGNNGDITVEEFNAFVAAVDHLYESWFASLSPAQQMRVIDRLVEAEDALQAEIDAPRA